jgi:hypothetical protein
MDRKNGDFESTKLAVLNLRKDDKNKYDEWKQGISVFESLLKYPVVWHEDKQVFEPMNPVPHLKSAMGTSVLDSPLARKIAAGIVDPRSNYSPQLLPDWTAQFQASAAGWLPNLAPPPNGLVWPSDNSTEAHLQAFLQNYYPSVGNPADFTRQELINLTKVLSQRHWAGNNGFGDELPALEIWRGNAFGPAARYFSGLLFYGLSMWRLPPLELQPALTKSAPNGWIKGDLTGVAPDLPYDIVREYLKSKNPTLHDAAKWS